MSIDGVARRGGRALPTAVLLAAMLAPAFAWAVGVTPQELSDIDTGMNDIFMQASFGSTPITINFHPVASIFAPALLTIDDEDELDQLFPLGPPAGVFPTVNMFFVDAIMWCGGPGGSIVGCADMPGNDMVLRSSTAAGSNGDVLGAHELGHNLGLDHDPAANNLMFEFLDADDLLTVTQVNTIFSAVGSPLQDPTGAAFVDIQPIFITAIPLPAALPLTLSAVVLIRITARRRRTAA